MSTIIHEETTLRRLLTPSAPLLDGPMNHVLRVLETAGVDVDLKLSAMRDLINEAKATEEMRTYFSDHEKIVIEVDDEEWDEGIIGALTQTSQRRITIGKAVEQMITDGKPRFTQAQDLLNWLDQTCPLCTTCGDMGWVVEGQTYSDPYGEQIQCPDCPAPGKPR